MNISLRAWTVHDIPALTMHANNDNIARWMTNQFPHPYLHEHAEKFVAFANSTLPLRIMAIDADGAAIGSIGIHPQTDIMCKNAELGYWLAQPYWNKGIITMVIPLAANHAFAHFDIVRLYARPFGKNIASQRVLEKCGFTLEARISNNIFKHGVYDDELIYALRK